MISRDDILQMERVLERAQGGLDVRGFSRIQQRLARWWKSAKANKTESPLNELRKGDDQS